jgi:hypothetical protein
MNKQNIPQWAFLLATAIAFGASGWALGLLSRDSRSCPAVAHDDTPAPHTLFAGGPIVALGKDGRVTLHADNESLSWVLAEIDRQAGRHVTAMEGASMDADHGTTTPAQPRATERAARPDDVLARVLRGTEPERYDTLMQSLNGGDVSAETLKTLYQTDASPRVRLLAFEYAQESTEGDPAARRTELEAAHLLPDGVIAQAAGRALETLDRQAREAASQDASRR